jgi:hypothetical protein
MASPSSAFLTRASENVFELGRDGYRLSALTVGECRLTLIDTGTAGDPPVYADGEPPVPGREGRREYDWQPAPTAPSWMHMAWLLEDLATWVDPLFEEGVTLDGIDAPHAQHCDVLVRHEDTAYRVRIALTGRRDQLDFPGMYLRDMFTEGRHHAHLAAAAADPGGAALVDLRGVL